MDEWKYKRRGEERMELRAVVDESYCGIEEDKDSKRPASCEAVPEEDILYVCKGICGVFCS